MAEDNPYVGPRPFPAGQRLYGREEELRELFHLLMARRIVALHSPSGAGKSSLLQAALIPRLKQERFDVWRTIRLNLEPEALATPGLGNRFVISTLACLEDGVPADRRRPIAEIAHLSLADYLEQRPRRPQAPPNVVLIFDQFEEILTLDPVDLAAKESFFAQLGEALCLPRYWALFALREDYLAALAPYREALPTRLSFTFRLDLLDLEAAQEAIVEPAREAGCDFAAADRLVSDLATIKVQQPDGSFVTEKGNHVEPVQLQVVCWRLWQALPTGAHRIDAEHLAVLGNVDVALAAYYRDAISEVAGRDPGLERQIRDFVADFLVTSSGLRGQIRREAAETGGLPNAVVERLVATHLLRAEKRAGSTWYELAHDRLLGPIQSDNEEWRQKSLAAWQQRAALWWRQERPESLLLRDAELAQARLQGGRNAVDSRFLEASEKLQEKLDESRRQTRRQKILAIVATFVGILALVAFAYAWREKRHAEHERTLAKDVARAALALIKVDQYQTTESALLALEIRHANDRTALDYLRQGVAMVIEKYRPSFPEVSAGDQVVSPFFCDASRGTHPLVAWNANDLTIRVVDAAQGTWLRDLVLPGTVEACAFDREGRKLLVLTLEEALVFSLDGGDLVHRQAANQASLSLDGERLAVATTQGWQLVTLGQPTESRSLAPVENADLPPSFCEDGQCLAIPTQKGALFFDLTARRDPDRVALCDATPDTPLLGLALSPKGDLALCRYGHRGPELWDTHQGKRLNQLASWYPITQLEFSPSGEHILGIRAGSIVVVLEAAELANIEGQLEPLRLTAETAPAHASFTADERWVLAVSRSAGSARISEIHQGEELALVWDPIGKFNDAVFTPDRRLLATLTADRKLRLWDIDPSLDDAAALPTLPQDQEGNYLQSLLRARNRLCLAAEVRQEDLDESQAAARAFEESCEKCVEVFFTTLADAPRSEVARYLEAWHQYQTCLED